MRGGHGQALCWRLWYAGQLQAEVRASAPRQVGESPEKLTNSKANQTVEEEEGCQDDGKTCVALSCSASCLMYECAWERQRRNFCAVVYLIQKDHTLDDDSSFIRFIVKRASSRLETFGHCWFCPTLPHGKLRIFCLTKIKDYLTLSCMLCDSSCRVSLLCWRGRVQHIADAWGRVCYFERSAIRLDAIRAQESVGPVSAVDVGPVRNWRLGERARSYCRRSVIA
jgi:hypothetical protein